jgi:hypothetical protein
MNKFKYPRTPHIDFSPGISNDDKVIKDLSSFKNKEIIITEKIDGECSSISRDYIHARSLDSKDHESRHWLKGLWGEIRYNIPEDWRICGENVYAKHSIYYENLESYFYVFNIWNENNDCLSFDETLEWCNLLNLIHVPVLYRGIFDYSFIEEFSKTIDINKQEGFVIRLAEKFNYYDFGKSMIKWVRNGHIQSDEHWMFNKIIPNKLKNKLL